MKRKDIFLEMSHGKARNILVRALLHKYVSLADECICFVCGIPIADPEELSIEHIEPWENVSVELFFDLNNVTFSHRKCNRPHIYGGVRLRKIGPEGTEWCCGCKVFLPVENFYLDTSRWNGFSSQCKTCFNAKTKAYRTKHREKLLAEGEHGTLKVARFCTCPVCKEINNTYYREAMKESRQRKKLTVS